MTSPATYWRTLKHLRWEQVLLRAAQPVRRRLLHVDTRPAPSLAANVSNWVQPARRAPSLVDKTTWTLLSETRNLDDIGWDDARVPLLWRYNQHYFDDLNAFAHHERAAWHEALIDRWIDENRPGQGTAWAPYPTSLRIANWIKWFRGGGRTTPRRLDSLAAQTRWLANTLEWHVLGNHLFVNAKALWLAGLFFDGDEAKGWLRAGKAIIDTELPEQVLDDGGQFERSPMYHALALEDVLDLINIDRTARALCLRAPQMHRFLRCMTHADGTLARFNDTADGIAPSTAELSRYAAALGVADTSPLPDGAIALTPSGYVRLAYGSAVALVDAAPVAPDYLMAHGHADTLAIELSLGAQRVIANGSTSRYGDDPERLHERSTWSHSTVTVDDESSSEVWAGFRCGRRARVFDVSVHDRTVIASHDGYHHLPRRPTHRRRVTLDARALVVEDTVSPASRSAVARFHLAHGLRLVDCRAAGNFSVMRDDECVATVDVERGRAVRGLSRYAPTFGTTVPTESLDVSLASDHDGARSVVVWSW